LPVRLFLLPESTVKRTIIKVPFTYFILVLWLFNNAFNRPDCIASNDRPLNKELHGNYMERSGHGLI
jgi:hypothetical protein